MDCVVVKPVKRKQFKLASCNAISNFINLSTSEIETILYHNNVMHDLKGQCHEIFGTFCLIQKLHLSPMWTGKTVLRTCSLSQRHSLKASIRVVIDYADTTMTTRTLSENYEDFKETIRWKMWLGVFAHQIAIT